MLLVQCSGWFLILRPCEVFLEEFKKFMHQYMLSNKKCVAATLKCLHYLHDQLTVHACNPAVISITSGLLVYTSNQEVCSSNLSITCSITPNLLNFTKQAQLLSV